MATTILKGKFMVLLLACVALASVAAFFLFVEEVHAPTGQSGVFATKTVMTTMFWVGEGADAENDYISNAPSYWDDAWQTHFGGVDNPTNRCGFVPCTFVPKENAFYAALPYAEYDVAGNLKKSATSIPWYASAQETHASLLKNRWIVVSYGSKTCYGQWEDVGPNGEDDFAYVFGSSTKPINTFGEKAGLDLSPAFFSCLGLQDNATTSWRFINEADVPVGPWRAVVTTRGISWQQ